MEHEDSESWNERLSTVVREVWIPEAERSGHSALHRRNFYSPGFVPVETVTNWDQYKRIVKDRFSGGQWVFRGHANSEWRLETSLERAVLRHIDEGPNQPSRESYIVSHPNDLERTLLDKAKQLVWSHDGVRPADGEILEWLSLLQHHGAPTRLLDWTRSPEIAAYFALSGKSSLTADSAVWVIDSEWLRRKDVEQHNLNLSTADSVNRILKSKENVRLIVCPAIVSNPRMEVQQGLFLCDLSNEETFDITLLKMIVSSVVPPVLPDRPVVWKIVIDTPDTAGFIHQLDEMKISNASLFPGHDFAGPLKEDIKRAVNELIEYVGWRIAQ